MPTNLSITLDLTLKCDIQFCSKYYHTFRFAVFSFRPNFPRSHFLEVQIRSSTTRMSTSHLPHTSSATWSPTASTPSGWPATAARVHPSGRPGWRSAPNKEVRPPIVEVFVLHGVWSHLFWRGSVKAALSEAHSHSKSEPCTLYIFCCSVSLTEWKASSNNYNAWNIVTRTSGMFQKFSREGNS